MDPGGGNGLWACAPTQCLQRGITLHCLGDRGLSGSSLPILGLEAGFSEARGLLGPCLPALGFLSGMSRVSVSLQGSAKHYVCLPLLSHR